MAEVWTAVTGSGLPPDLCRDGVSIFDLEGEAADQVSEFIALACNAYRPMLEALEEARSLFAHGVGAMTDNGDKGNQERNLEEAKALLAKIEAAIAKAKGEDGEASNG